MNRRAMRKGLLSLSFHVGMVAEARAEWRYCFALDPVERRFLVSEPRARFPADGCS